MSHRVVTEMIRGTHAIDGAGVHLTRVLGPATVKKFDPFLMLGAFDSSNLADYTAGFPMHPHRGIETVSYLSRGRMLHRDSMGNEDQIGDGEVQWMTAGSGILHEETIPAADRMLGTQLWLNLPQKDKMAKPFYRALRHDSIESIDIDGGKLRLIAGKYKDHQGHQGRYVPFSYYEVTLEAGATFAWDTPADWTVFIFTLLGDVQFGETHDPEKTAALTSHGETAEIRAQGDAKVLIMMAPPLSEPIAWGGPIVMNSDLELQKAFSELRSNTFLKEDAGFDIVEDSE